MRWVYIAAVVVGFGFGLVRLERAARRGADRRVDGRAVTAWARVLSTPVATAHADVVERRRAATALSGLLQLGAPSDSVASTVAASALGTALSDPDTVVTATAAEALGEARVLPDATIEAVARAATAGPSLLRLRAAELLSRASPGARPAAARALATMTATGDTLVQAVAAHHLVAMLPQLDATTRRALLPLVSRATHADAADVRASALEAYATYADAAWADAAGGPLDADSVWATVGPALTAPPVEVRVAAAAALGGFAERIVPRAPRVATTAIAALVRALGDADPEVRREAVTALGAFGDAARSAVPALHARLADTDRGVQRAAQVALSRLGVSTP